MRAGYRELALACDRRVFGKSTVQFGVFRILVAGSLLLVSTTAFAGDDEDPSVAEAKAVSEKAEALEASGEWRSASWQWMKAWETDGNEHEYGLRAGLAAHEAGDCPKAKRLLDRYLAAEAGDKRGAKKAEAALDEITEAKCATPDEETAKEDAKSLFVWAEEKAAAGEWEVAMYAYEDAYFLVPAKVGFAFKVGKAAFEARRCAKAAEYLAHFARYGDTEKHAEMLAEADGMQNRLETLGCGESEAPPPAGKEGCSLDDSRSPLGAMALLLPLFWTRRRR